MMIQSSLDQALAEVEKNANEEWKNTAFNIVKRICMERYEFTMDDVHSELQKTMAVTHDLRALGIIILKAAKAGYCENTGNYVKSTRAECHQRPIQLWHSRMVGRTIQPQ